MTALRCRPGDLAVVVQAKTPGMLGRFVIVERAAIPGERFGGCKVVDDGSHLWMIKSAVSGQLLPAQTMLGEIHQMASRPFADHALRPIRPQPDDAEDTKVVLGRRIVTASDQRRIMRKIIGEPANA